MKLPGAGETPFDRARLRSAAFDELLRIIREEDPPRPSIRLGDSQSLPSIAANRQIEPKKLSTLVRSELDWIVMKALEKDRLRRYETANGFAADIERYLGDEPNRDLRVHDVLQRASYAIEGRFTDQPLVEAAVRTTIGQAYCSLGEYDKAALHLERAQQLRKEQLGEDHADSVSSELSLLWIEHGRRNYEQALRRLETVVDRCRRSFGNQNCTTMRAVGMVADFYRHLGRLDEAERLERDLLRIKSRVLGPENPHTLVSMNNLGITLKQQGRFVEAEQLLRQSVELGRRVFGPRHPYTLASINNLAYAIGAQGRYSDAEKLYQETLDVQRRVLGPEHPDTLKSMRGLANAMCDQGRYLDAEKLYREVLDVWLRDRDGERPCPRNCIKKLADSLRHQGKNAEVEELYQEIIARDADHFEAHLELGKILKAKGNLDEAVELFRRAAEICPDGYGAHNRLGLAFRGAGNLDEAEAEFLKCIELNQSLGAAPFNLAGVYVIRNEPQRALALMDERGATWPVLRGPALVQLGRLDEAIDCLRLGLDDYRSKPERLRHCRFRLAQALQKKAFQIALANENPGEDLTTAESLARESIKVTSGPGDRAWAVLALVQYRAGEQEDARKSVAKALDRNSNHPVALLVQAIISWEIGEHKEAADYLSKARAVIAKRSTSGENLLRLRTQAERLILNASEKTHTSAPSEQEPSESPP